MTTRKALHLFCLIASTACLALAYGLAGRWPATGLAILAGLAFLLLRRSPAPWMPTFSLVATVCIAAAGLLMGTSAFLMILGACLALGAWDLASFDISPQSDGSARSSAPLGKRHALSLALALGLGLLLASGGIALSFRVPFPVLFLIVILDLFSLDRALRSIAKEGGG